LEHRCFCEPDSSKIHPATHQLTHRTSSVYPITDVNESMDRWVGGVIHVVPYPI